MTPQNLPKTPLLAAVAALALAGCAAVVIPPAQLASADIGNEIMTVVVDSGDARLAREH